MLKVGPFAYFDNIEFNKDIREYLRSFKSFKGLINKYLLLSLKKEETDFHHLMYLSIYIYHKIVMTKSFVQTTTMDTESWS